MLLVAFLSGSRQERVRAAALYYLSIATPSDLRLPLLSAMSNPPPDPTAPAKHLDFIREMVSEDVATNRFGRQIATRFPPEPNGFSHIGHLKPFGLNFGIAMEFGGRCNLRFDDTNPETEDARYVEAIKTDIKWLGYQWDVELYASDYFGQLYDF